MAYHEIIVAGFGGQGVMSIGTTMAETAMAQGLNVSWLPSYGPEMRGGTANCNVVIADTEIISPIVLEPSELIAMNQPSLRQVRTCRQTRRLDSRQSIDCRTQGSTRRRAGNLRPVTRNRFGTRQHARRQHDDARRLHRSDKILEI